MICIECGNPDIECLYSRYKSEYIKLTVCQQCHKISDKYIEYDLVILFLDILLLKKQAYRHLVYNRMESEILDQLSSQQQRGEQQQNHHWRKLIDWFQIYKLHIRRLFVIILFEVYLKWANEERKTTHRLIIHAILSQSMLTQYLFFIMKLVIEQFIFNFCIIGLFRNYCGWGQLRLNKNIPDNHQFGYSNTVLLSTVMVSSSIKLFPILMLIWPYDRSTISQPLINTICFINIVEALRVITNYRYVTIISVVGISLVTQVLMSRVVLAVILKYFLGVDFRPIYLDEMQEAILQARALFEFSKSLI